MDEKEISCGVCCRKLESGDGRYNISHGSICTDCYSPSFFLEMAVEKSRTDYLKTDSKTLMKSSIHSSLASSMG